MKRFIPLALKPARLRRIIGLTGSLFFIGCLPLWSEPARAAASDPSFSAEDELYFLMPPLMYTPRVSSGFSTARLDPVSRKTVRPHCAVDLAAPSGTIILASGKGVLVKQHEDPYKGKYVELEHPNGYKSRYFHLSRHNQSIKIGDTVSRGASIGYVGTTGNSTGPHLHYMLSQKGNYIDPQDFDSKKNSGISYKDTFIPLVYYREDKPQNQCSSSGVPAPEGALLYYGDKRVFDRKTWDGLQPLFHANGKPYLTVEMINGKRIEKTYYENGNLKSQSDGRILITYYPTGQKQGEFPLNKNGSLEGEYKVYSDKGELTEEGGLADNELDGESRHYGQNGVQRQVNYYFEGMRTTREQMLRWQEERRQKLLQFQEDKRGQIERMKTDELRRIEEMKERVRGGQLF
ncbi:MAG: peptidoglycan DD-metalloendopeptidase family protein [Deltaproteobacteria bacterium]|jgi:murein DD-endopeptidase MepM/ murein hydrolase activator NlpD|nr:peptidoglycan DD-metalloendopeptidase family protein [Deltaproteobacteria bacterium]